MTRVRVILSLALLASLGCNNKTSSAVSFAFNRPERLDFACLAQYTGTSSLRGQYTVLPTACCNQPDPSSTAPSAVPPECLRANEMDVGTPLLHALVTQSTRGEVAAVDLTRNRVLDSDRQVPGFTFLDSGGLPSAIVVPPRQPRSEMLTGPTFFYVASAEEHVIRAIRTCRLRGGPSCGPDPGNVAGLRVPLRGAPEDMMLGPDEALWVTVPDLGLIARIGLPSTPRTGAVDAFEMNAGMVAEPTWFTVPAVPNVAPPLPVAEDPIYASSCGLGVAYTQANFTLPLAPRVPAPGTSEPTRLNYDADSKLLLVADRGAPGLHVFRVGEDGSLIALGALPTGQPVREFVITPRVPTTAIEGGALVARTVPAEDEATETKRYLYAIDALGTVMVFEFVVDPAGGLPTLTPLLAPAPDLAVARYADRIALPQPSQTLEIVDSRPRSDYVCGQESIDDLKARESEIRSDLKELPASDPQRAALVAEQQRVAARIVIHDNAQNTHLRGVFVAVASTAGVLSMIDVHDLDSACRAQKFCCASEPTPGPNGVPVSCTPDNPNSLLTPRNAEAQNALMVRRHTVRRRNAGPQTADVASSSLLAALKCDDPLASVQPHASVQLSPQVCGPADPYSTLNETWRVYFEGTLPNSQTPYAYWVDPAPEEAMAGKPNLLALEAPAEFDFCARGVEPDDLVAVIGRAPEGRRASCPDPSSESLPTFVIERATNHRLLVSPRPASGETAEALRARVLDCYPDYVGVELRARKFMVLGASGTYLHRIVSDPDGVCVTDPTQDPLLNSRVNDSLEFSNPFVKFVLAPAQNEDMQKARETSLSVSRASTAQALTTVITGDRVTDALPSTLRYLPEVGYLFLLDTAGQGLRRYTLEPFQRDTAVVR